MATIENLEGNLNLNSKRTALQINGLALAVLAFQTLGIIYSDIGTSPLYVLNGIWPATGPVPPSEDVIGGVSAIVWSLTLLPLVKYVFTALAFGTREGEGGLFALYQGLFPPLDKDFDADRTLTGDSGPISSSISKHSSPRIKQGLRWPLLVWCLFGTSLTMADGIFTPAVSVTSAISGIGVAKASITKYVTPISIVILVMLFFIQRYGTGRLAWTFSPIAIAWFFLLAGTGIYNITFYPTIFRAWDPSRAILLFVRTKNYDILSGVLLAITGCEAIFANLGQFNTRSIRLSFSIIVYPSLILAYLGQGARVVHDGEAVMSNIFYQTIPGPKNGGLYWIMFIFATLATIIASQAMITGTFSLAQQLINTKCFPPVRMQITSEKIQGQVYIPAFNWTLMVLTIIVVGAFPDLSALTNAYGFAVATVMFSTTLLLAVHIYSVKRLPIILALGFFLFFGFLDALFWGASYKKVPKGAWVPLVIGVVMLSIMLLWTWAKGLEDEFDGENRRNLRRFIQQDYSMSANQTQVEIEDDDVKSITESNHSFYYMPDVDSDLPDVERKKLQRIPTCAIFHKIAQGRGIPHSFIGFIRQWPALPRIVIFLSVCVVPIARVPVGERYVVTRVRTVEGFYGVTYYIGFRDDFDVKANDLIDKICQIEAQANPRGSQGIVEEIRSVSQVSTHIVPHYHVASKPVFAGVFSMPFTWIRRQLIEEIYRRLATMFPETGNWLTSADEIIHVGINAMI